MITKYNFSKTNLYVKLNLSHIWLYVVLLDHLSFIITKFYSGLKYVISTRANYA